MAAKRGVSVYFITCRDVNMVKIGYSDRLRGRVASLRVCCPLDVKLELMLPGGKVEEQALHKALAKDRVRGEWFWITEAVQRFIDNPPPPPREHPDLVAPYTDLAQHERLVKRLRLKRRAQRLPETEAERLGMERIAKVRARKIRAAEDAILKAHHSGSRQLAKLEARGDITFPFRAKADA